MNERQIRQNYQYFVLFEPQFAYFINASYEGEKNELKTKQNLVQKTSDINNLKKLYSFSFFCQIPYQPQKKTDLHRKAKNQQIINSIQKSNISDKIRYQIQQNFIIFPRYSTRLKQIKQKKKAINQFRTILEKNKKSDATPRHDFYSTKASIKQLQDSKNQRNRNYQNKFDQSQQQQKKIIKIVNITDQQPIKQQFFQSLNKLNKYFFLQKRSCRIQNKQQKQELIIKRCKHKEQQKSAFAIIKSNQKMLRQLNIIKNLSSHKYLLKYYKKQDQKYQFYMESIAHCLKAYVQMQQLPKLNLKQKLKICFQLIQAVLHLHSQKVVHRDIKPENILFSFKKERQEKKEKQIQIKIIDFSDSVDIKENNYHDLIQNLGCTLPFSHILCLGKQGFNDKKVDFWSVGAVIYWLIFGYPPIKVHQPHKIYCYEKWKDLFCHQINLRYHSRELTEYLIKFVCLRLMRINLSLLHQDDLQISKQLLKTIFFLQYNQNIQAQTTPQNSKKNDIKQNTKFNIISLKQQKSSFNQQQQVKGNQISLQEEQDQ